eukprot:6482447-Amphidinium_carterae.1
MVNKEKLREALASIRQLFQSPSGSIGRSGTRLGVAAKLPLKRQIFSKDVEAVPVEPKRETLTTV